MTPLEQLEASLQTDLKEIRLSDFEYIHDLPRYIDSHLATLKAHTGNKRYLPFWERLVNLADKLKQNESKRNNNPKKGI